MARYAATAGGPCVVGFGTHAAALLPDVLRRIAHPFWFQSVGSVMGMDWHSSAITTSVLGALKRGLFPLFRSNYSVPLLRSSIRQGSRERSERQ